MWGECNERHFTGRSHWRCNRRSAFLWAFSMNCECEYGKCTEVHGCPVRSTKVQQTESEESWPVLKEMLTDGAYYLGLWTLVFALLSCIAMVVSVAYWGKPLWYWFF